MVLGDAMLYLHTPKTGGTYTAARLEELGLGEHVSASHRRPHVPVRELPSEWFTGRLCWSTIRNPWDWYVSWVHHFTREDGTPHGQLADRTGPEPRPFRDVLRALLWPEGDIERLVGVYRQEGRAPVLAEQAAHHQGLYSWLLEECCSDRAQGWVDLADVDAGMSRLLGVDVQPSEPLNVSGNQPGHGAHHMPHGPISDYYDDESIEWVRYMDRAVVDRFGFAGPGSRATRGVA